MEQRWLEKAAEQLLNIGTNYAVFLVDDCFKE